MSLHFSLEQMARLRDSARRLELQAAEYESTLASLLERAQLARDEAAPILLAGREHRVAATRLMRDLGDLPVPPVGERPARHAVLIADGYKDSRESMSIVLHDAGFIVRTASNGLEAVIAAYEMAPAVIVMDMMMPVLDGIEATRLIKAIDEIRHTHVIAYTAQPTVDAKGADELFSAVLMKPARPDVVVAAVQRYAIG